MKNIQIVLLLFTISLFLSCGSDDDTGGSNDTFWKCKLNGQDYESSGLNAYAVDFTDDIAVYGTGDVANNPNAPTMYISIDGRAEAGVYTLDSNSETIGFYIPDLSNSNISYTTLGANGSGEINVTSNDGNIIEGTFNFVAQDFTTEEIVTVTEGEFRVDIRL